MKNTRTDKTGIKRITNTFTHIFNGFKETYKRDAAFRQEFFLGLFLIPIAFLIGENNIQKILLISSILILMLVEIINSAIEAAINQISINQHHASITAKDMGKAAVFVAIINAVLIWLLILF